MGSAAGNERQIHQDKKVKSSTKRQEIYGEKSRWKPEEGEAPKSSLSSRAGRTKTSV